MVTKKIIKSLDFQTIEDYFNYIINSEINGNRSQVRNLINDLSNVQKAKCLNYIGDNFNSVENSDVDIVKNLILQSF